MTFKAGEDLALILPIPTPKGVKEDDVAFLNLEKYPNFFDDLNEGFPAPETLSRAKPGAKDLKEDPKLVVVEVGSYIASFVPAIKDFARLDEKFQLPGGIWEKLPQYKEWGFAVFQLKKGHLKVHPMAFEFTRASAKQLFFPTVHIHDGSVPAKAKFDHLLYCQPPAGDDLINWNESHQLAESFMKKLDEAHGIIDPKGHVYRKTMKGIYPNEDKVI